MIECKGYAAASAGAPLKPFSFQRRSVGPSDVLIAIQYCGICHSDIHQARGEWGNALFPMVPGHEIVGKVTQVGGEVSHFKVGDAVGVGCFVDSCRTCRSCTEGLEQYCEGHLSVTYNGTEQDQKTPTFGGYSNQIVVDHRYVVKVPSNLKLEAVAPLLCAGITTYSPLRQWGATRGLRIGVVGLGGLGHMAVKFAVSFEAEVTVFSTSPTKEADARRLGASKFVVTKDPTAFKAAGNSLDLIIDTVSNHHPVDAYLNCLRRDGTMVMVGASPEALPVSPFSLLMKRRRLVGSLIGGIRENQEMLDYCGQRGITSDIELTSASKISEAYERTVKGDVRYRFVVDCNTL